MAETDVNYTESKTDRKDRNKRTARVIAAVLFAVILIASLFLYLEITGSRGGEFIDRITVNAYLKKNYGAELGNLSVSFKGYNAARKRYEYDCTCDKGTFLMASKNFRVRYDGYYAEFLCDPEAEEIVRDKIVGYMKENWIPEETGASLELKVNIRIPYSDGADKTDVLGLLEKYGSTVEMEATLSGRRLTFAEYKVLSYDLLDKLRGTIKVAPEFMQVFYYRDAEEGETGPVLSYESQLKGYMFNYNQAGYTKATDVNFVVELSEKERSSLQKYTLIRVVNFVVIGLAVVGLGTLFIVRKIKKKKKQSKAEKTASL